MEYFYVEVPYNARKKQILLARMTSGGEPILVNTSAQSIKLLRLLKGLYTVVAPIPKKADIVFLPVISRKIKYWLNILDMQLNFVMNQFLYVLELCQVLKK